MRKWLIILLIALLLVSPVFADNTKATTVTTKINDKTIRWASSSNYYLLHTVDYGDIEVLEDVYIDARINDTVKFTVYDNGFSKWIGNIQVIK